MKYIVLAILLLLVVTGCASTPSGTSAGDNWTYVKGPHGENCLTYSSQIGTQYAVFAMSCDKVIP